MTLTTMPRPATRGPGRILGHEGVGIIDKVGPAVTAFKPGDHKILSPPIVPRTPRRVPHKAVAHPHFPTRPLINLRPTRQIQSRDVSRRIQEETGATYRKLGRLRAMEVSLS
jgi:hypothetical protein